MDAESKIKLSDLLDNKTIQKFLDNFCQFSGIAATIVDADYKQITKPAKNHKFCQELTRKSAIGLCMCEECDRFGAEEGMKEGKPFVYRCHTDMIEFTAPIYVDDQFVGSIIGGQVLSAPPDREKILELAKEYGISPEEYWEAAQEIPIQPENKVKESVNFLQYLAEALSQIAYSNYISQRLNEELAETAKMQGDFLANMSHEIRTPMNAVLGFTELALREDVSPAVKDYLEQIQSSSSALLTIINDILDFSKIRSNKLDIIPIPYEPLSIIDDIAGVTMTRLADKDVELLLDVDPNIPCSIEGDSNRIRQILINLCNNATKFTHTGSVTIKVDYNWLSYSDISLNFHIIDTGIGIKEENLQTIFESFKQVDSKRNRNIEGTGLGLAITKMLLELMGSHIEVESRYGQGSDFYFSLKQKVIDPRPSVIIDNTNSIIAGGAFANKNVADAFLKDAERLGVEAVAFDSATVCGKTEDIKNWLENIGDREGFYFIEQQAFDPDLMKLHRPDDHTKVVLLAETFSDIRDMASKDILILRKPLSVMNLGCLFNHNGLRYRSQAKSSDSYNFTAESAAILIVDDNSVNLAVAKGLLEPTKASIDTAISGKEALHKIRMKKYDLIFMDHMMPEMDGVETTHIIRKDHLEYKNVPIIALTANAMSGVKEMFVSEGMNDFVAKPVEVKVLMEKVRQFLPKEKLVYNDESLYEEEIEAATSNDYPVIGDFDTEKAIGLLGSRSLYENVLKIYYEDIDDKAANIERLYKEKNWKDYSIAVHALKSSSRQIGAMELGELAYTLEMAGKNEDIYLIDRDNDKLINMYKDVKNTISRYYDETSKAGDDDLQAAPEKLPATRELLEPVFCLLRQAVDDLDMDGLEKAAAQMEGFEYPEMWEGKYRSILRAVKEMDTEEITDVLDSWN